MGLAYKKLVVWQRADDLFIEIHRLTHQLFPSFERYELGSQLRRAAYSVPANVVEGSARPSARDKIKFFNIASASLSEVTYGIHAAFRLGYIDQARYEHLDELTRMVAAPLAGLIRHHRASRLVKAIVPIALLVAFLTGLLE
jgi:four helix bundle protein